MACPENEKKKGRMYSTILNQIGIFEYVMEFLYGMKVECSGNLLYLQVAFSAISRSRSKIILHMHIWTSNRTWKYVRLPPLHALEFTYELATTYTPNAVLPVQPSRVHDQHNHLFLDSSWTSTSPTRIISARVSLPLVCTRSEGDTCGCHCAKLSRHVSIMRLFMASSFSSLSW